MPVSSTRQVMDAVHRAVARNRELSAAGWDTSFESGLAIALSQGAPSDRQPEMTIGKEKAPKDSSHVEEDAQSRRGALGRDDEAPSLMAPRHRPKTEKSMPEPASRSDG